VTFTRVILVVAGLLAYTAGGGAAGAQAAPTGPVIVVETTKGTFEFETYPREAPKTVAHIVALVKRGFYDGQRFHRALPGFLIQWGDPQSRDLSKEADWGRGAAASSGTPIGIGEITKKRAHGKYAVGVAHAGNPALADSQIYVTLEERSELNGRYAVFGRILSGEDVADRIERGDVIRKMSVKE
jgi:cyclophilin family peptidyl-prolyl cis-trans isomerase